MAVEIGAALHGQGRVDDVALDPRRGGELDLAGAHAARDLAADHHGLGKHLTGHGRVFADDQRPGADVAFHRAVKLHFAFGQ